MELIQQRSCRAASGGLEDLLERADGRWREAHRRHEASDVGVLRAHHRACDVRAALLESREQRVGEAASDPPLACGRVDTEEFEPPCGLFHAELPAADLAEHE